MKSKLLLIGAGEHGRVVLDLLLQTKEYQLAGLVDAQKSIGTKVLGIPVIGKDGDLLKFYKKGIKHAFIAIGSIGKPDARVKVYQMAQKIGFQFPNLIHPSAIVSPKASLGVGNYIGASAIVNVNAKLMDHCIINSGAIVEHDCEIGNFVHVSPGAVLGGNVKVGDYSHVGIGSTVIQGMSIGAKTTIGAGSVVTNNIRGGMVAYGNPCKEVRNG